MREKALLRRAIATCTRGVQQAYEAENGADTVIHDIESEILSIRHTIPGKKARTTRELALDVVGTMEDRMNRKSGLTTGFYDLDKWTSGGLQPGEMWVLAGRPSMGKTSLAMDIGRNVAEGFLRNGRQQTVLVFSLEMTAEALTERLVAGIARVNTRMDRMPKESDMARIMDAVDQVAKLPIVIDDTSGIPVSVIKSRARAYFQRFNVGLFILDFMQIILASPVLTPRICGW